MRQALCYLLLFALACSPAPKEQAGAALEAAVETFVSPTGIGAQLPHLTKGDDGKLYLSWVIVEGETATMKYACYNGNQWTDPEVIARGDNWFVNWADYPTMAADNHGNLIAHYPAKSGEGTYAYDVNLVFKPVGASNWSGPVVPHTDGTQTEHGFVSMEPMNDGSFLLAWLDGRYTGGGEHNDGHSGSKGAMTVRTAVVDMEGHLSEEAELDRWVCDCCHTGMTITSDGAIIVYRDRSEEEIRDMYFVRKTGDTWSDPVLVAKDNWSIAGCPVNGPRIASFGDSVAVAWFTAAEGNPKVKLAFSGDGSSFAQPILIDDTRPLGRVDVVMLDKSTAIVSWLDNDDSTIIKYRMVKRSGEMSPAQVVAVTDESRSSGFPQMELFNGTLYFAWTVSHGEGFRIEMASLEL